ncbi:MULTISPECIES: hypothetical protein [Spirulina sp. CCY15215]|uniref:hypothetical protein n=1 Tax=Spirulina sp. CCY15215 TaxID=2767591 RepID=UPI0019526C75|nr:hypothetical protein [Spirulina major]
MAFFTKSRNSLYGCLGKPQLILQGSANRIQLVSLIVAIIAYIERLASIYLNCDRLSLAIVEMLRFL